MSSTRAKLAAASASVGVLVIGWQVASAGAHAVGTPAATGTDRASTTQGTRAAPAGQPAASGSQGTTQGATQRGGRGGAPGGAGQSVTLAVPAGASGTFTGAAASHRYGSVTVTVTLSNGRITALRESVASDGDRRSEQINSASVPQLRSAILASSGQVSTISGATYTTRAYLTSLQSALDKA